MSFYQKITLNTVWISTSLFALSLSLAAIEVNKDDQAKHLTALEVIRKNIIAETSKDEETNVEIILQNSNGKTQKRTLSWRSVTEESGDKKTLVYFEFPKFIQGTALLTFEHSDTDDERWLYLPSIKKTRRISGTEKSDNFFGTDFSYEDLVSENTSDNNYRFTDSNVCSDQCYIIEATPSSETNKTESGYSKRVLTIDSKTFSILAIDYFDKSGRNSKKYQAENFQEVSSSGLIRPFKTVMKDLINDHMTIMNFQKYEIDTDIDVNEISLRALTRR